MEFLKKLFKREPANEIYLASINLPYDFLICRGEEASGLLHTMRKQEGITPVIMGNPAELELLIENLELSEQSVTDIIESADSIQFPDWFITRADSDPEYYQAPHGEWPQDDLGDSELSAHKNVLTRRPLKQVLIGKVPTETSWQVPAYLKLGGWNECPLPHEHVALFRKWAEEYSAQVACVTSDVIEFTVERPPTDRERAIKLAEEQFLYCSDIVYQGAETIENLASLLMNSKVWYFWWD